MAKPGSAFTWATDVSYTSGPANGFATKIVIPDAAQALVPGDDLIPEYLNFQLNILGDYTGWIFDGSPTGAADAHVVETDALGDTVVRSVTAINRVEQKGIWWRQHFMYPTTAAAGWGGGGGSATISITTAPPSLQVTASSGVGTDDHVAITVSRANTFIVEVVFRITTLLTDCIAQFLIGEGSGGELEDIIHGVGLSYDTTKADTEWTLVGVDTGVTTSDASGVTVVQNTWVRARIEVAADGSADMFMNGATVADASIAAGSVGTAVLALARMYVESAAATRTIQAQRMEIWQPGDA